MVHVLGDGILLKCEEGHGLVVEYYEEVPVAQFNEKHEDTPRFTWVYGYNQQARSLTESIAHGTVFELFMWYFGAGTAAEPHTAPKVSFQWKSPDFLLKNVDFQLKNVDFIINQGEGAWHYRPKELFSMRETLHTSWDTVGNRKNTMAFLLSRANELQTNGFCAAKKPERLIAQLAKRGSATEKLSSHLDVTVPAAVADKKDAPWYPGQVNVWIQNTLDVDVALICDRTGERACDDDEPIPPGGGANIVAFDTDTFSAIPAGESVALVEFRVDVSRGIVQDWVIGLPAGSVQPHEIAERKAKKSSVHQVKEAEASVRAEVPKANKEWKRGDPKPPQPDRTPPKAATPAAVVKEVEEKEHTTPAALCEVDEIRIAPNACAVKSNQSIGQTAGTSLKMPHYVPMFLKPAGSRLQKIMPWLKKYVLEREQEWAAMPRGAGAFDAADPTVTARSTQYNLLSSGRSSIEKAKLKILRDAIGGAVVEFMNAWTAPGVQLGPLGDATAYRTGVNGMKWENVPDAWVECWCNVHRAPSGQILDKGWEKYTYIRPHSHAYPISGYISLDAEPSETLFRSPWEDQELFTVEAQNSRMLLFPGEFWIENVWIWYFNDGFCGNDAVS